VARHICKYNNMFCGAFGYDDLCHYCKRMADLEIAQRGLHLARRELDREAETANRIRLEVELREARRREANAAAARALGEVVGEYPRATAAVGLGLGALLIGAAISGSNKSKNKD